MDGEGVRLFFRVSVSSPSASIGTSPGVCS